MVKIPIHKEAVEKAKAKAKTKKLSREEKDMQSRQKSLREGRLGMSAKQKMALREKVLKEKVENNNVKQEEISVLSDESASEKENRVLDNSGFGVAGDALASPFVPSSSSFAASDVENWDHTSLQSRQLQNISNAYVPGYSYPNMSMV